MKKTPQDSKIPENLPKAAASKEERYLEGNQTKKQVTATGSSPKSPNKSSLEDGLSLTQKPAPKATDRPKLEEKVIDKTKKEVDRSLTGASPREEARNKTLQKTPEKEKQGEQPSPVRDDSAKGPVTNGPQDEVSNKAKAQDSTTRPLNETTKEATVKSSLEKSTTCVNSKNGRTQARNNTATSTIDKKTIETPQSMAAPRKALQKSRPGPSVTAPPRGHPGLTNRKSFCYQNANYQCLANIDPLADNIKGIACDNDETKSTSKGRKAKKPGGAEAKTEESSIEALQESSSM